MCLDHIETGLARTICMVKEPGQDLKGYILMDRIEEGDCIIDEGAGKVVYYGICLNDGSPCAIGVSSITLAFRSAGRL